MEQECRSGWVTAAREPNPTGHQFPHSPGAKDGFYIFIGLAGNSKGRKLFCDTQNCPMSGPTNKVPLESSVLIPSQVSVGAVCHAWQRPRSGRERTIPLRSRFAHPWYGPQGHSAVLQRGGLWVSGEPWPCPPHPPGNRQGVQQPQSAGCIDGGRGPWPTRVHEEVLTDEWALPLQREENSGRQREQHWQGPGEQRR